MTMLSWIKLTDQFVFVWVAGWLGGWVAGWLGGWVQRCVGE